MKRVGLIALAAILLIGGPLLVQRGGWLERAPSPESFDKKGFALWPEDTARAGRRACSEHADDQPWRLSAKTTAERFTREVFRWDKPKLGDGFSEDVDSDDTVQFAAFGAPTRLDLGHSIDLFRYYDCWFVREVEYREFGPVPDLAFIRDEANGTLLQLRFDYGPLAGLSMEAGYGGNTRQASAQGLLRIPVTPGVTGHLLSTTFGKKGGVGTARGFPLPVPPDLDSATRRPGRGGLALYPYGTRQALRDECADAESFFDYGRRGREPLISFAMDVLNETRSSDAPRITTTQTGKSTWRMRTPNITIHFDSNRTSNGCWIFTDVTTATRPIAVKFLVGEEVVSVDADSIPGADTVEVLVAFGDDEVSTSSSIDSLPLFIPLEVDPRRNGYYLVIARDAAGKLVAVEGHALKPLA